MTFPDVMDWYMEGEPVRRIIVKCVDCKYVTLRTVKEKEVIKCLKCEGLVKILAEEKKK